MCYAPPYLITAHPNNTIKQFLVQDDDGTLQISYKCTLYGHTFKVDALAVDVVRQRLISGDRSGIKVWDLDKECCQVTIENHRNQSTMSELPLFEMNSLGFDEDKIIAAVQTEKTLTLRLWSFILEE
jgi:WD40 repeat protein